MGAQVINFPGVQPQAPQRKRTPAAEPRLKYFTAAEIRALRKLARDRAEAHEQRGNKTGPREWMAIDVLTSSGLRVSECADLRVGDVLSTAIFVRNGKGSKARTVQVPEALRLHLRRFIGWKAQRGEPTGPDDFLFVGQRGPWTAQAIQELTKGFLRRLGLYQPGKSVHALRHSYAVEVYRREKDLRAVALQLGHSSTQTTQIYAAVLPEDIHRQVQNLWGGAPARR